ncbi:hypothetical protein [Pseudoalteromonas sp. MMG012]|uniref:TlpA family protein disulfide reductase n=1 Tax=Pseudoalteromonas sp. MMG012 TaxID=2822686 RepID=UPI001B39F718|nr:hypothetical protein [Pseudoalteromonas sp. MMG012]MBQ4848697.1 hypothetical protein [Pseudoalteromonas sp. MMG012]
MLDLIGISKLVRSVLCVLILMISGAGYGYVEQLTRRLDDGSDSSLYNLHGPGLTLSFFTPECTWCKKQHRVLTELAVICRELNPVMVGINGNKVGYKQTLRRMSNTLPAIVAPQGLVAALPNLSVPRVIVIDSKWQVVTHLVGFSDAEMLLDILQQNNMCS